MAEFWESEMTDRAGDESKKPPECVALGRYKILSCPNMKERDDRSFSGETYDCAVCGERIFLDYEDMK